MTDDLYIWSAAGLGLLGSFHCAGMCGPIALALPMPQGSLSLILTSRIIYNIGRILSYILIGVLTGFIGNAVSINGFQGTLSIITGISLLLFAVFQSGMDRFLSRNIFGKISTLVRKGFAYLFRKKGYPAVFLSGSINGFLPCGMVYMAAVASLGSGTITGSMGYMLLFGIGTMPMMLFLSSGRAFLPVKWVSRLNRLGPALAIVVGLMLIQRGSIREQDDCCKPAAHHIREIH